MSARIIRLILFTVIASVLGLAGATPAPSPPALRLYVFDCGKLDIPDITPYRLARAEIATNVMSVPCFLVAHPKGTLMWDVGAVPDRAIPDGGTGKLRVYGTSTKKLETQLQDVG